MRIDEFSNAADIDGSISSTEMARFMLFGFDINLVIVYALLDFIAKNKTFNFNARDKNLNFIAKTKPFNFNAKSRGV